MASLRKAVDAMCKDCIYDESAKGTWREQVSRCGCTECPLFEVRPQPAAATPPNKPETATTKKAQKRHKHPRTRWITTDKAELLSFGAKNSPKTSKVGIPRVSIGPRFNSGGSDG